MSLVSVSVTGQGESFSAFCILIVVRCCSSFFFVIFPAVFPRSLSVYLAHLITSLNAEIRKMKKTAAC